MRGGCCLTHPLPCDRSTGEQNRGRDGSVGFSYKEERINASYMMCIGVRNSRASVGNCKESNVTNAYLQYFSTVLGTV